MKQPKKPVNDELCALDELKGKLVSVIETIEIARKHHPIMDLIYPALAGASEEFYRFRLQKAQLKK